MGILINVLLSIMHLGAFMCFNGVIKMEKILRRDVYPYGSEFLITKKNPVMNKNDERIMPYPEVIGELSYDHVKVLDNLADEQNVPREVWRVFLQIESGGRFVCGKINSNNTYDVGPFQLNTAYHRWRRADLPIIRTIDGFKPYAKDAISTIKFFYDHKYARNYNGKNRIMVSYVLYNRGASGGVKYLINNPRMEAYIPHFRRVGLINVNGSIKMA